MEIPSFTTWLQTVTWIEMFLDVRLSRTVALRILAFLDERHVATWLLCYECDVVRSVLALKKGIWMQSALHYAFLSIRAFHPPNNEFRWNLVLESANVGWFLYVERNPYFTWKSNWSLFIVKLAYLKKKMAHGMKLHIYTFFFSKSSSNPLISGAASVWSFVRRTSVPYCVPSLNLLDLLDNIKLEVVKVSRISDVSQCEAQHSGIAWSQ